MAPEDAQHYVFPLTWKVVEPLGPGDSCAFYENPVFLFLRGSVMMIRSDNNALVFLSRPCNLRSAFVSPDTCILVLN